MLAIMRRFKNRFTQARKKTPVNSNGKNTAAAASSAAGDKSTQDMKQMHDDGDDNMKGDKSECPPTNISTEQNQPQTVSHTNKDDGRWDPESDPGNLHSSKQYSENQRPKSKQDN